MRTTSVGMAGSRSVRWRPGDIRQPGVGSRRRELAAGLATAAIAGQLMFAPAVLLGATALVVIGRFSRWRPHWLAAATVASVISLFAVGLAPAVAAFAAGSRHLAGFLLAAAIRPGLLARAGGVAGAATRWSAVALPSAALPSAMVAACLEAWLVLWLVWWRPGARLQSRWRWRPGLAAAIRRRASTAAIKAGYTVTRDGCAIGVSTETGKLASFTWAEASQGVLLTGEDRDLSGLAIACAALKRRKTVVVFDCAGQSRARSGCDAVAERVGRLARAFGVPVTVARGGLAAAAIGRAIRCRETVLVQAETQKADEPQQAAPADLAADSGAADLAAKRASADLAVKGAAANLAAVLSGLRDLGLRADCVAWLVGVELMDPATVGELLALGPATGTVMVSSTADSAFAARLASGAAVLAIGDPLGADLELSVAARLHGSVDARTGIGREIGSAALLGAAGPPWRPIKERPGGVILVSPGADGSRPAATHYRAQPIAQARRP